MSSIRKTMRRRARVVFRLRRINKEGGLKVNKLRKTLRKVFAEGVKTVFSHGKVVSDTSNQQANNTLFGLVMMGKKTNKMRRKIKMSSITNKAKRINEGASKENKMRRNIEMNNMKEIRTGDARSRLRRRVSVVGWMLGLTNVLRKFGKRETEFPDPQTDYKLRAKSLGKDGLANGRSVSINEERKFGDQTGGKFGKRQTEKQFTVPQTGGELSVRKCEMRNREINLAGLRRRRAFVVEKSLAGLGSLSNLFKKAVVGLAGLTRALALLSRASLEAWISCLSRLANKTLVGLSARLGLRRFGKRQTEKRFPVSQIKREPRFELKENVRLVEFTVPQTEKQNLYQDENCEAQAEKRGISVLAHEKTLIRDRGASARGMLTGYGGDIFSTGKSVSDAINRQIDKTLSDVLLDRSSRLAATGEKKNEMRREIEMNNLTNKARGLSKVESKENSIKRGRKMINNMTQTFTKRVRRIITDHKNKLAGLRRALDLAAVTLAGLTRTPTLVFKKVLNDLVSLGLSARLGLREFGERETGKQFTVSQTDGDLRATKPSSLVEACSAGRDVGRKVRIAKRGRSVLAHGKAFVSNRTGLMFKRSRDGLAGLTRTLDLMFRRSLVGLFTVVMFAAVCGFGLSGAVHGQTPQPTPCRLPDTPSISAAAGPLHKQVTLTVGFPARASYVDVYTASQDAPSKFKHAGRYYQRDFTNNSLTLRIGGDTNKTYYAYAVAVNGCGSTRSGTVSAKTFDISPPPVTAQTGTVHKQVVVTVTLPKGVDFVHLYKASEDAPTKFTIIGRHPTQVFINNKLTIRTGGDTNKTYYFYAVGHSGTRTKKSATVSAKTLDISPPPVTAQTGTVHKQVVVTVTLPKGVDFVHLYKASEDAPTKFTIIGRHPTQVFINNKLTIRTGGDTNKTYYFYAVGHSGTRTKKSATVSAKTLDISPPPVTAQTGTVHKQVVVTVTLPKGVDFVHLYKASEDAPTKFTRYDIYPTQVFINNKLTIRTGGDTNKTYYFYAVGHSGTRTKKSATVSAKTLDINPPTITAAAGKHYRRIKITVTLPKGVGFVVVYSAHGTASPGRFTRIGTYPTQVFTNNKLELTVTGVLNTTNYYYAEAVSGTRVKRSNTAAVTLYEDQGAGLPHPNRAPNAVGCPVNVTNGNMYLTHADYVLSGTGAGIRISRTYNSLLADKDGIFGKGWASRYDEQITAQGSLSARLSLADGRAVYFRRDDVNSPFEAVSRDFYGQLVKNADGTYTVTFKGGSVHEFNSGGKLTGLKDRSGNQTTLTYDASGSLTSMTDAFGRVLTVATVGGRVTRVSDALGKVADYVYNADGTLQSATYADNSKYQYEYVKAGARSLLATVKDALNNILETHSYDSQGRATTSERHGGVEKYTIAYGQSSVAGVHTRVTDGLGRTTRYYHQGTVQKVITKIEGNCSCGSGVEKTSYEYDAKLNVVKETDALGNATTYTYDADGNMLTATDELGTVRYYVQPVWAGVDGDRPAGRSHNQHLRRERQSVDHEGCAEQHDDVDLHDKRTTGEHHQREE